MRFIKTEIPSFQVQQYWGEYKYTMCVKEGAYFAQSLWGLFTEVFTHRCWHLFKHGRWTD